jgi:integrase
VSNIKLRYLKIYRDRHGRVRTYLRRPGFKPVALPGLVGSPEFLRAYGEAVSATAPARAEIAATRTRAGTVNAMIVGYLASAEFHKLAATSQGQYRRILEGLRREYGDLGIATLRRKHVVTMLDDRATTPSAARDLLRCLKLIVKYAISIGMRDDDPTAGVRVKQPKSDGFRVWAESDIAAFEAAYPLGSKPRLALALLLGTAARIADVVRLGRGHVRDGAIHFVQQKTGVPVSPPLNEAMVEAINAAAPSEHVVFLLNEHGRAFTAHAFSKWFVKQCRRAGLPKGLSAHGLRKAACRRLADAQCTVHEIAAVSGHASLREVERYTKAADRIRLARSAVDRLKRTDGVR